MNRKNVYIRLPEKLLFWYDKEKRDLPWRKNTDPYRVWVSEIMLQQTRVEAVREYYLRFINELPTVQDLAQCPEEKLYKLWEGLGYYSRVRNMQKAAKEIVARGGFPRTAEELCKLSGIGQYTAGAIASIAFSEPSPAVDGNVVRVLSRIFADDRDQSSLRKIFHEELNENYPKTRCGDFTQSLMELGAIVCTPRSPKCLSCPVYDLCETRSDKLPVSPEKRPRKRIEMTVFIFITPQGIGLCKRNNGVLKGLWQFPNEEKKLSAENIKKYLALHGISDYFLRKPGEHKHVFTHMEWLMTAYPIETNIMLNELHYFPEKEIGEVVALPSAFSWCMKLLKT